MTLKEVAEKYKITPMAVHHWCKAGLKYRFKKIIGKKPCYWIEEKDLDQFLKNRGF